MSDFQRLLGIHLTDPVNVRALALDNALRLHGASTARSASLGVSPETATDVVLEAAARIERFLLGQG